MANFFPSPQSSPSDQIPAAHHKSSHLRVPDLSAMGLALDTARRRLGLALALARCRPGPELAKGPLNRALREAAPEVPAA